MSDPIEQRMAEAMASFGHGITPPVDGWADVVSRRVAAPDAPGRQRLVVALAAAVLVAVLVAAGAAIATRGDGEPARATTPPTEPTVPPAPSTEATTTSTTTTTTTAEATTTSSVPEDLNAPIAACLEERGVAFERTPADGGNAISAPDPATEAQLRAFSDGLDACSPPGGRSPEEQAEDLADAERYFDVLVGCLGEAGITAEAVRSDAGIWDVVTPGVDQATSDYRAAFVPCAERAQADEAANG